MISFLDAASGQMSAPPPEVVIILLPLNDSTPYLPNVPSTRPSNLEPKPSAASSYTVLYSLLQQTGIHIPGFFFRIHEHRPRPQVGHRMRRRAEREALHHHLIPGPHPAGYQRQMHRSRSRRQSHHLLPLTHKLPQVVLEPVHIGPQRNHPVRIECLLYEGLLRPAHVSQAEVNSLCHKIAMILII